MTNSARKITLVGMFSAVAVILSLVGKLVPSVAGFLDYDPKDIIIVICGFMLGPFYAVAVTVVASFVEFVTFSSSGIIGLLMNILSSLSFALVPSLAYKWKRTLKTAVIGLVIGVIFMTGAMVLWNYLVTPVYMHVPRSVVVGMLPTVFLPFNLVKGTVNAVFTVVLYKPLVKALRKISIIDERTKRSKPISVAKLEPRTPKKIIKINLNEYINGKH
jgi:riboflavin transporter FmnP